LITGRLVIATHNPGKLAEMRELLASYGIEAVSAGELGLPEPNETGTTFCANARIKAEAAAKDSGMAAFADDSGLAVDALGGEPGIQSARWAGPEKDFRMAMSEVQTRLMKVGAKAAERRRAHFVSALCVAWPDGHVEEFEAQVHGTLVWPPRGTKGFGYDAMFLPDGHARTFGEMDSVEKHGLPPARNQAEWTPVSRPDCAPNDNLGARTADKITQSAQGLIASAKPVPTFAVRAPGKGLSHRARAFLKLAEACLMNTARPERDT
jgi:XTP/dITP diphosphohydrolase